VQSSFLFDSGAYSGSFLFVVLSTDEMPSLQVLPASGANVSYQINAPARYPPSEVEGKLSSAGWLLSEYATLESQVHGAPMRITVEILFGLVSAVGCVWLESDNSATLWERVPGVMIGLGVPACLGGVISEGIANSSHAKRMGEIRQNLHALWQ
jgi:hypothetical protein